MPMDQMTHGGSEHLSLATSLLLFLSIVVLAIAGLAAFNARRGVPRHGGRGTPVRRTGFAGLARHRPSAWWARLRGALPEGRLLPEAVWTRRHRIIVELAFVQAFALGAYALLRGDTVLKAVVVVAIVAVPAIPALLPQLSRNWRAVSATTSLMAASATLVELSDGITEAHFSFFVMVGVVSLYQAWAPFGSALVIVVLHHGIMGTLAPHQVFSESSAMNDPWIWAAVHGGFVLACSLALVASWRMSEQQGLHDPLTGLANRVMLLETANRALRDPDAPVSLLFVDLDDFKGVNDSFGHAGGDALLRTVAHRLREGLTERDLAARFGGDEFAVLLYGGPTTAQAAADRLLASLAAPAELGDAQVSIRVSIGVADSSTLESRDARSADALVRNADLAMYLAKACGKDRVAVFTPGMHDEARERALLVQDLTGAVERGELEVYYQPTVQLDDGSPYGVEALVRWHHPEYGMVAPARFIPLAESTGLIGPIGNWVLTTAVHAMAAMQCDDGSPVALAVNISPRQLVDDNLLGLVTGALEHSGMAPQLLTLEITEGVLVHDFDVVAERLARLRALGVRIAVDDFGTGYAGLSFLRQLPVDIVKIDRSFVDEMTTDPHALTLVQSIVDLAHSLGVGIVAEGIENEAQATLLRDMRCGRAQGFLYSRPKPQAELTEFHQQPSELPAAPPTPRTPADDTISAQLPA